MLFYSDSTHLGFSEDRVIGELGELPPDFKQEQDDPEIWVHKLYTRKDIDTILSRAPRKADSFPILYTSCADLLKLSQKCIISCSLGTPNVLNESPTQPRSDIVVQYLLPDLKELIEERNGISFRASMLD